MTAELRIFETPDAAVESLGQQIVQLTLNTVGMKDECTIALSGGSTPVPLYRLLGTAYGETIPWGNVHLFWGDERFVPPDSEESNYRLVRETMLENIAIPEENVYPFDTNLASPKAAADNYQQVLREHFLSEPPSLDLVLLGMGDDGHTASLFPGTDALRESERWVTTVTAHDPPRERLTLTYPVLNAAEHVFFLVTGERKAEALHHVRSGDADIDQYPSAGIRPERGELVWFVDRAAASLL